MDVTYLDDAEFARLVGRAKAKQSVGSGGNNQQH
jgi:hypothetical protein